MIISRTPFRMSFFGGGTDYPEWFREHTGSVLVTSIDKYCYISCRFLPPFFEHKSRIVYSKTELVKNSHEITHPAVREALKHFGIEEGVEIHHDGDLPARTGLGSSSSFTVGLCHTLYALKKVMPTKEQLARKAILIERTLLQECVGSQDQYSTSYGGFNHIRFHRDDRVTVEPIILAKDRLIDLQSHLLLFFTGFQRTASKIAREQVKSMNKRRSELTRMHEMVQESLNLLCGQGSITEFGNLLHESWNLKRSLSNSISTPAIDSIYETARKEGAIGGKLLGAGSGGFMMVFAKPEHHGAIRRKLRSLLHVPFKFEGNGSQIIFYDPNTLETMPLLRNREFSETQGINTEEINA